MPAAPAIETLQPRPLRKSYARIRKLHWRSHPLQALKLGRYIRPLQKVGAPIFNNLRNDGISRGQATGALAPCAASPSCGVHAGINPFVNHYPPCIQLIRSLVPDFCNGRLCGPAGIIGLGSRLVALARVTSESTPRNCIGLVLGLLSRSTEVRSPNVCRRHAEMLGSYTPVTRRCGSRLGYPVHGSQRASRWWPHVVLDLHSRR
jgi:hypothetical protein